MTDIGRRRNSNEDQFVVADLVRQLDIRQRPAGGTLAGASVVHAELMAVADGMGGQAGGGIASEVAVRTIAEFALNELPWFGPADDPSGIGAALAEALRRCQAQLERTEGPPRMGTTLTMAYVVWPQLIIAHVGDSRCYLLREGHLEQLTRDHTVAQQLVESHRLAPEELPRSPLRDVLWNAVGGGSGDLTPELRSLELMRGDTLLLCSDGLTKHVDDRTLAAMLTEPTHASPTCERLIGAANAAGGSDNVTVIVARY